MSQNEPKGDCLCGHSREYHNSGELFDTACLWCGCDKYMEDRE